MKTISKFLKSLMFFEVKENSSGSITLYATDAYNNKYAHTGYEYNVPQLFEDIFALYYGENTWFWDGNDLINDDIVRAYRQYVLNNGYDITTVELNQIMYDDGKLIPLDMDDYIDNHITTKTILEGDANGILINLGGCGISAFNVIKFLQKLFKLGDGCPKITILNN